VLGRRDDVINSGGEKIAPSPIEALLERIPGVREAAVIGTPDPDWGQRVEAVLVADKHTLPDELILAALLALPAHQRPKNWRWSRDPLPRTALGKLRRRALMADLD
jgi:o-succinylbenzoate---CoA ligase